jgi:hypothetical protein
MNKKFCFDLVCDASSTSSCKNPTIREEENCIFLIFVVVILVLCGVRHYFVCFSYFASIY